MSASSPKRYLLAIEWPDIDQRAWASAHDHGDYFSNAGLGADWAASTRLSVELAYGTFLLFLRERGRLASVERIGQRLELDVLQMFVGELSSSVAPKTVVSIMVRISQAVRVMDPAADRSRLMKALSWLALAAKPVRDIDSHLLPPDDLLRIGEQMMDEAETSKARDLERAVLYRDGLMIMFFVLCPIRRANMQKIQLGEHLFFEGDCARLKFGAGEMKGRREFDVPLPAELAQRIRRYIEVYRPIFLLRSREDTAALWLTIWGTVMTADRVYLRMKKNLLSRTGKGFTPHMFRHACASFIADMAPERSHIAATVLHHRSLRTTRKHYVRGQQHRAVRKYQSAVTDLAKSARRSKKKRGGSG